MPTYGLGGRVVTGREQFVASGAGLECRHMLAGH